MENIDKILLKIHNDVNLLRLKNFNLYDYKILFTICSEVLEKGTELVQIPYAKLKDILNLNNSKTITDKYLEDIVKTTHEKQKLINFNINNKFYEGEASLFTEIYKSKAGVKAENIFKDIGSGKDFQRIEYQKLVNKILKKGDVLYITSVDRLGRDMKGIEEEYRLRSTLQRIKEEEYQ